MKKIWDNNSRELIEMPEKMKNFLNEIKSICKKYDLSISHEDCFGSFIIENYNSENIEWLFKASKGYKINKEINMNKINCTYNVAKVSLHLDGDKVKMLGITPIYRNIPTIEEAELLLKLAYIQKEDPNPIAIFPNNINLSNMGENKVLADELAEKYKSNIEVCNISADTRKE